MATIAVTENDLEWHSTEKILMKIHTTTSWCPVRTFDASILLMYGDQQHQKL